MTNPPAGPRRSTADGLLLELEERHERLCAELAELERRLRRLRTAADLCAECGGSGVRWVRGGMYGEHQQAPCSCRREERPSRERAEE